MHANIYKSGKLLSVLYALQTFGADGFIAEKAAKSTFFSPETRIWKQKKKKKIPFWKSVPLFSGITQTHPYGM